MNTRKQFLKVLLNNSRVLRLSENLQQIVIADEVESWKFISLFLKEVAESLLATFQLVQNCI